MPDLADLEFQCPNTNALIRRLTVGPLQTNCWIIADPITSDALIIDPGDEASRIINAFCDLNVRRVCLTHAHWDHVLSVPEIVDATGVLASLHASDFPIWPHETTYLAEHGHFDAGTATTNLIACGCPPQPPAGQTLWDGRHLPLRDNETMQIGNITARIIATPGHTPGSVCISVGRRVFSGDTLFPGGPGLTGWPLSDFTTIIDSIEQRLFTCSDDTIVHPGHGADTTIGAERPHLQTWIDRGW